MGMFSEIDAAFKAGDLDALRRLATDDDRFPDTFADLAVGACLPYAIYHGPLTLISALLDEGANPNFDPGDGFPPVIALMSCVTAADHRRHADAIDVLELLLLRGADPDQRGLNDYTPLHWVAGLGDLRLIECLLAAGANPLLKTRIDDLETPRELAVAAHQSRAAQRLVEAERTFGDLNARDEHGQTALMRAAQHGDVHVVRLLVHRGVDLNHSAKYHLTALMLAVVNGHAEVVRALVRAGADQTIRGTGAPGFHGKTARDLADARGDRRIIEAFD